MTEDPFKTKCEVWPEEVGVDQATDGEASSGCHWHHSGCAGDDDGDGDGDDDDDDEEEEEERQDQGPA